MDRSTFLQYLKFEKRFSIHTITAYHSDLDQFEAYTKDQYDLLGFGEIQHVHIRSWIVKLMQEGVSSRSINRKLSSLKCYFKYLIKRGAIQNNPLLKIIPPKSGKNLPAFVRSSEITRLFEKVDFENTYRGRRDRAILETLYSTGMRRSELINLKKEDIDFDRKLIKVLGKRKKTRIIPFSALLTETLETYIELREEIFPPDGFLFLTDKGKKLYPKLVYNLVTRYLSYVTDSEKKGPHVLRHSFATHISENGGELNSIKELLGHSSLSATQIYTHNSIEKMKNAYNSAHPKSKSKNNFS